MKRKFKLISSIASLTTAIALLAFGVFAFADKRNVQTSGTITFSVSGVDATVEVWEGYTAGSLAKKDDATFVSPRNSGAENPADQNSDTISGLGEGYYLSDEGELTYVYEIIIKNDGDVNLFWNVTIYVAYEVDEETGDFIEAELPNGVDMTAMVVGDEDHPITDGARSGSGSLANKNDTVKIRVTYTVTPSFADDVLSFSWNFGSLVELATGEFGE